MTEQFQLPPQSLEHEQAALGCCLISTNAAGTLLELLREGDFYLEAHRKLFRVIEEMRNRMDSIPVDILTLQEALNARGWLEACGGVAYLTTLAEAVPTATHAEYYCEVVRAHSLRRQWIAASQETIAECYTTTGLDERGRRTVELAVDEVGHRAEERILAVSARGGRVETVAAGRMFAEAAVRLVSLREHEEPPGFRPGWVSLEKVMGRLKPQGLTLLAARPSMGKTAVGLALAYHLAQAGVPTLIYSLEMRRDELEERWLAAATGFPLSRLEKGDLNQEEWGLFMQVMEEMRELPLFVVDESEMSVGAIRGHARRACREHGLGCIIIDQLQSIHRPESRERKAENENVALTRIAYALKAMAGALNIHLILECQLNRNLESRESKRPVLSDLRDSGSLEQVADNVLMLYRQSYYDALKGGTAEEADALEILVRKRRQGATGTARVWYDRPTQRISEIETHREADGCWQTENPA